MEEETQGNGVPWEPGRLASEALSRPGKELNGTQQIWCPGGLAGPTKGRDQGQAVG